MKLLFMVILLQASGLIYCSDFNDTILFEEIFRYLNKYNGMNLDHVLITSTEDSFQNEDSAIHALLNTEFIKYKTVSYVFSKFRVSRLSNEIIRCKSTLIILLDDNLVSSLSTFFEDIPEKSFVDNTWLLISSEYLDQRNNDFSKYVISSMKNSHKFLINSHIYFALSYKGTKKVLFEAYKFCHDKKPVIKPLMIIPSNGVGKHRKDFIWNRRKNLRKCRIRVGYVNTYEIHDSTEAAKYPTSNDIVVNRDNKIFYGMKRPIFNSMVDLLNFSIDWVKAKEFGSFNPLTGEWSGIIKLLADNQADMSINWFFVTSLRAKYITFTVPFQTVDYKLFMKKSRPSTRWGTFTNVLSFEYLEMILLLIFLSVVCYTFYLTSPYTNVSVKELEISSKLGLSIVTVCLSLIGFDSKIIDNTNGDFSMSKRLLQITICFFGIINFYVYNGGLISSLMVQKYESAKIDELTDFLEKPEYKLLIDNNIAVESYLSTSSDTKCKRLWEMVKSQNGLLYEPNQGEERVMSDSNNMLLSSSPLFEYSSKEFPCNIVTSRQSYGQERVAFAFNNKSVYIELFNYHIKRVLETGVKLFPYSEKQRAHCETDEDNTFRPMTFPDIFSAFVIVGIGCLVALTRGFIEYESKHRILLSTIRRMVHKMKNLLSTAKITC